MALSLLSIIENDIMIKHFPLKPLSSKDLIKPLAHTNYR